MTSRKESSMAEKKGAPKTKVSVSKETIKTLKVKAGKSDHVKGGYRAAIR